MKKKIILMLAMVALLVCAFAISVSAAYCIDGIYYTLNDTGAAVSSDNQKNCTLETVVIPDKVKIDGTEYPVTTISTRAFGNNSIIKSVTVPASVTSVGDYAFTNCLALTTVNCKSTILGNNMFYNCPAVKNVTLENTVTISNHAFCNTLTDSSAKQTQIDAVVFPDTLESIGMFAFARCQITEIVLPASLETIGTNAFVDCEKLEKAVVLGNTLSSTTFASCGALNKLVLTEKITYGHADAIKDAGSKIEIYYTGTDYQKIKDLFGDGWRVKNAVVQPYDPEGNYTGTTKIIYGCNLCVVAFEGIHTEPADDGDCTTAVACSMCGKHIFKEAIEHIISKKLTYTSFLTEGEYCISCTNDGCEYSSTEKIDALFTCLGYSTPKNGRVGLVIGFEVNNEAIAEYEEATGKTLKYGAFATSKNKLGENDVIDKNGTATDGAIKAEVNIKVTSFDFILTGFETDAHKNAQLALGAYVAETDGETTKYFCLQYGTPEENEKYCFVSYNSIVENPSADEDVVQ